jgi:hypothetical protein
MAARGRLRDVHSHVALLAGRKSSGEAVLEEVPAEHLGGLRYRLAATPGLALGCAEADVVTVTDDGSFEVEDRGGNLGVHFYGSNLRDVIKPLRDAFEMIGGRTEAPDDASLVVATVPASAGFESVESAIRQGLFDSVGVEWFYGNVYDEHDQPLNWWLPSVASE